MFNGHHFAIKTSLYRNPHNLNQATYQKKPFKSNQCQLLMSRLKYQFIVQSLKTSILRSTSIQLDNSFSGLVSAAVEQ